VRHILIILSFLLLSSPVIGQSSKYESVSQCVLQTMTEKKLTGNKMFEMVKEECERSLGRLEDKKRGVLYWGKRNGKYGWEEDGDEKKNSKYVGEVKYGIPYGQGTLTYLNGNKYVGEVKYGIPYGQGTYSFPNGDKYVGEWKDGKKHGYGTLTYLNGEKYVGEFKDGEKHGQGTYTWSDGRKYVGEYKDDKKHGQGTFIWSNGDKYVGEYKDGEENSQGTYTWSDGSKYVGEYKDGEPWNGTIYDKEGNIHSKVVNGKGQK